MNIPDSKTPSVAGLFALALAAATLAALHAGWAARDLDADGSYYLLMARGGMYLLEPARKTVQALQQSLAFAGSLAGVTDMLTLGQLLTLGMQGWPVLITGVCWFALPRGQKGWILGPLLNLAAVIPATSFIGIGEGMIASCLMWLLFLLVEFDGGTVLRLPAAIALAAACFTLHEAAFPFMLGIGFLAGARAVRAPGLKRLGLALVALLSLAAAIHLFTLVIHPRDPTNRGAFLFSLFSDAWITRTSDSFGINLPALGGLAAGLCLLLVYFAKPVLLLRRACFGALVLFAVIALLFLAVPQWVAAPQNYFAARGLPIMATMVLAAMLHLLRRAGWKAESLAPPPVRLVLASLIGLNLLIQTVLTVQWTSYRDDVSALLAPRRGIIAWDTAAHSLNPDHAYLRGGLLHGWSLQTLSIVLAPGGMVAAAVDARPGTAWKPYRLNDPTSLPFCVPGLDWSLYLAVLGQPEAQRKTACPPLGLNPFSL